MPSPPQEPPGTPGSPSRGLDTAIRELAFAVRALQLYPASSPVVRRAVSQAHERLAPLLRTEPLALTILPQTIRAGSGGADLRGRAVSTLAERLHERGVADVRLTSALQPDGLQNLVELLATDVDTLNAEGGISELSRKGPHEGFALEMLQLDKLYEGTPGDGDATTAVWERLLDGYGGGEGAGMSELLAADSERLGDFFAWLLDEDSPLPVSDMSRLQLVRAACERIGGAAAALGADRVEAAANVIGGFYPQLDKEVWLELLGSPTEGAPSPGADGGADPAAPGSADETTSGGRQTDLTRAIGAALSPDQVEELLTYALTSREKATPRILGLFRGLLEARSDHDAMEQAIRNAVERQTKNDAEGQSFADLWPQLNDALQGEQMDGFVSTSYRAELQQLLTTPASSRLWDVPRIAPRFRELDPAYLVQRKVKIIVEILDAENSDEEYGMLIAELERSLPELIVGGQYIATEDVLKTLEGHLIPSRGLNDTQRAAARDLLIRFCNRHTLREVVRNLAGMPATQIAAAARIFDSLGPMAVPALLEALSEEKSRPVRVHLVRMLAAIGDRALPEIRKHLRDKRWFFVRNLAWIIGEIGDPRFVPHLGVIVNHPDVRVRREAVRSLAKLHNEATTEVLLSAVDDSNPEVQLLAVRGLGTSGTASAIPRLRRLVRLPRRRGRNTELVRAAAVALGRLGAGEALDDLARLARRPWFFRRRGATVREAAAWALANLRGEVTGEAPEARTRGGDAVPPSDPSGDAAPPSDPGAGAVDEENA